MNDVSKIENTFYAGISEMLKTARNTAYKAVNSIMRQIYWQTGERIIEQGLFVVQSKFFVQLTIPEST
jgi:hypothetical protein